MEHLFASGIEPKGNDAIEALIASPDEGDFEQLETVLAYLIMQRIRVPRQLEFFARHATSVAEQRFFEETGEKVRVTTTTGARFTIMRELTGHLALGAGFPYLARMKWRLFSAEGDAEFITSDSPVSFYNAAVHADANNEAGIGHAGTVVQFPLSPKHLLTLRHPEFDSLGPEVSNDYLRPVRIEDSPLALGIDYEHFVIRLGKQSKAMNSPVFLLSQRYVLASNEELLREISSIEWTPNKKGTD